MGPTHAGRRTTAVPTNDSYRTAMYTIDLSYHPFRTHLYCLATLAVTPVQPLSSWESFVAVDCITRFHSANHIRSPLHLLH